MRNSVDMCHPDCIPRMIYANQAGEIIDLPDLEMVGRSGSFLRRPERTELIPLPEGSELFVLPDRYPVGFDRLSGDMVRVTEDPFMPGAAAQAVAAFVAPAHTALYTTAFDRASSSAQTLPLFAYTAVGWHRDRFWVGAFRCDPDLRQDTANLDQHELRRKTLRRLRLIPENRLIQHLGRCCLTYGCPAARNYFLGRWEAPLPTSPDCNASCVGCISLQPSGCCPATQDRIAFVPTVDEIVGLAVPHLEKALRPVVSFGQGCEGEPLLQARVIEGAIKGIRERTGRGTINLNTNASLPSRVERLAKAGLESMRASLNSARREKYALYYRPRGYSLDDVLESAAVMKRCGRFVSLNYFILPGFTDDPAESDAFFKVVEKIRPDMIQLRNLNMDPDWYLTTVRHRPRREPIGILNWLGALRKEFSWLRFGYFNPRLENEKALGKSPPQRRSPSPATL